jgi:hypothetical protein
LNGLAPSSTSTSAATMQSAPTCPSECWRASACCPTGAALALHRMHGCQPGACVARPVCKQPPTPDNSRSMLLPACYDGTGWCAG